MGAMHPKNKTIGGVAAVSVRTTKPKPNVVMRALWLRSDARLICDPSDLQANSETLRLGYQAFQIHGDELVGTYTKKMYGTFYVCVCIYKNTWKTRDAFNFSRHGAKHPLFLSRRVWALVCGIVVLPAELLRNLLCSSF